MAHYPDPIDLVRAEAWLQEIVNVLGDHGGGEEATHFRTLKALIDCHHALVDETRKPLSELGDLMTHVRDRAETLGDSRHSKAIRTEAKAIDKEMDRLDVALGDLWSALNAH